MARDRDDDDDWQTIAVEVPIFHRWFVVPGLGFRRAMIRRWLKLPDAYDRLPDA
jgi:hypothetical protein